MISATCLPRRVGFYILPVMLLLASAFVGQNAAFAQLSKPTALVKGEVRSDEDQTVVQGLQIYITKGSERVATAKTNTDGKFTAIVQPGAEYRVAYTSANYAFREDTIVVPAADKFQEIPLRATVTPLRDNQDFTPKQPVFKHNSAAIEAAGADRLEQLATLVRKNSRVHLEIDVYPDYEIHSKKDAAETKLLNARASALRTFFLTRNIPSSMIEITSHETLGSGGQNTAIETTAKGKKKASKASAKSAIAQAVRITSRLS